MKLIALFLSIIYALAGLSTYHYFLGLVVSSLFLPSAPRGAIWFSAAEVYGVAILVSAGLYCLQSLCGVRRSVKWISFIIYFLVLIFFVVP